MKKTVSIISLGCKVNQYESLGIAKILIDNGFTVNIGLKEADVFVINTCAVTNESERKSRGMITKVKKLNPNAQIFVCGCSAQNNPSRFAEKPGVVAVVGTSHKTKIAQLIMSNPTDQYVNNDIDPGYDEEYVPIKNRTRCYIKIQDGCNNFCSYCLIPYLRGRERSRKLEDIKQEIDRTQNLTSEIILTGINMSAYGKDFANGQTLADVIKLFEGRNVRFRISSLEANIITDEFLQILKKMDNFCPHFHLSMQSGSNTVLRDMNRHYTKEEYLQKTKLIRKYFPNAGITTDVIVGFPTETEELFEETMQTIKEAKFSEMHIFPFSPRSGTVATRLKNVATNIPCRIKKVTALALELKSQFIAQNVGQIHEVLVEEQVGEYFVGHTKNYIKCYVKADQTLKENQTISVQIEGEHLDGAIAKRV